ncbi:MAG: PRC-barrel domain-containing protein [Pseudooceanicola sp.]
MKHLLLTTALVTATATGAFAQSDNAAGNDAATGGMSNELFRSQTTETELHASDFIGMRVYAAAEGVEQDSFEGAQENWEDIGEINDVILSREGEVQAVLVDIGGFLGIGERQVAVQMDAIDFVSDSSTAENNGDFFLVLKADRATLEGAPAYGQMQESADASGQAMENDAEQAEQTAENAAEDAGEEMEETADAAGETMEDAAEETEQTAENAAEETGEAVEQTADAAEQTMENAAEETEETAEAAGESMEDAAEQTEQTAENAAEETGEAVEQTADAAEQTMENAAEETEETAEAAGESMEDAAEQTEQTAENAADEAGEEMEQTADAAGDSMENAAEETEQTAENATGEAGEEMNQSADAGATLAPTDEGGEQTADANMQTDGGQPNETAEQDGNNLFGDWNREGYAAVEQDYLTTENLTGARVYDTNDKWVGEISELLVNDDGEITEAIVDVGGFLGIGEKPVALQLSDLKILRQDGGDEVRIYTARAEEELESMPEFED